MRTTSVLATAALLAALAQAIAQQPSPPLAAIKAAAEAGDPIAQDKLAGTSGLPSAQAEAWYRKAADRGVVNSQYQLGHLLFSRAQGLTATPVSRATNADEALRWLTLAATQGDRRAQLDLSRLLQNNKLVRQDDVEAYKWSALAAQGGSFDPTTIGGRTERDSLILKMTSAEIAEGQRRVQAFAPHLPTQAELPQPGFLRDLKLKSISGTDAHRLALINNQTFQAGDELNVKAGPQTVSVRCLEILSNSVLISVNGSPKTIDLRLR